MRLIKHALMGALVAGAATLAFASPSRAHPAAARSGVPSSDVQGTAATAATTAAKGSVPMQSATTAVSAGGAAAQSLATLGHLAGPIRIAGESAATSLVIPLSPREQVRSAMLHLVATNSVSLLAQRSQLAVRLDDRTIAQFALSPSQPELAADIRVPTSLLQAGYNRLNFAVAQHATNDCEEKDSPELWTEIDSTASTLQLDTRLLPLDASTLTLSRLNDLIDPRQSSPSSLTIVDAVHPASDLQLSSGGLLAQGVALRLRYLNGDLHARDAQSGSGSGILPGLSLSATPDSDLLLMGTRDQLARYVDPKITAKINGGFLAIYPRPDDSRHFVLIVSGNDEQQVNLAARVFAHAEIPLPNQRDMTVTGLPDEGVQGPAAVNVLHGTAAFRFSDLGYKSVTLGPGETQDLQVRMPADLYAPEDAQVALTLNFSEGAKMRSDSVLNVYLNGTFERAVALDQQEGAVVSHYRMPIPLRHFRPGENTITLRPVLIPLVTDRCTLRQSGNLLLSVFDNSSLSLPSAAHFARLPDLRRFAQTGFPYVTNAAGSGLAIQLRSGSDETLSAAWMLLGKLAQDAGRPLSDAQITRGDVGQGRNTIVMGVQRDLLPADLSKAPWQPGKTVRIPTAGVRASGDSVPVAGWQRWFGGGEAGDGGGSDGPGSDSTVAPVLTLSGDLALARQLLVMQYRGAGQTTTTLITAASAADMAIGVGKLIDPQYWSNLAGDVSVLGFDAPTLWTARVGSRYDVGHVGALGRVGYEMSTHPLWGYLLVIAVLLLLAALSSILLLRYKRRHHGQ